METLHTRRNSHFDVNIICVPEYFCHPTVDISDIQLPTLAQGGFSAGGKTLPEGDDLADAIHGAEALAIGGQVQVRVQHCNDHMHMSLIYSHMI